MEFKKVALLQVLGFVAVCGASPSASTYPEFFHKVETILLKENSNSKTADPEVTHCLSDDSLSESMRYFLYRRFINLAQPRLNEVTFQRGLRDKFGTMAYLACRESNGRAVAQVPHKKEKEKGACFYGATYAKLILSLKNQITLRNRTGVARYFNQETNGGPFQVSADQVDNLPDDDDKNLIAHHYFVSTTLKLAESDFASTYAYCGTAERFNSLLEPALPTLLKASLLRMTGYIHENSGKSVTWFRSVESLASFHEFQTLCPMLHFEIAMILHHLKGGHYFGPLNNTKSAASCGNKFALCRPIYERIYETMLNSVRGS